jgi:hypothetical protein
MSIEQLIAAAKAVPPGVWTNVEEGMPDFYEEVRIKDQDGFWRIGRRSKKAKGIWQIASFEREGSKYPLPDVQVVAWTRIHPPQEVPPTRPMAAS